MKRDLYGELLGNALNRGAPPGHFAAYIRPDESNVLRSMGGGVAPDGGQNMYNGMPAYFSGISAVSAPSFSAPSVSVDAPSVNAPSVNFDIQSAVDQGATVAEEFAQAQAQAEIQAQSQAQQDQAQANMRSGGIAAAAEQARSQGIADILADRASIGSMYDASKVGKGPNTRTGTYVDKDARTGLPVTRSIYDSGERGRPGQTSNTSYPGGSPYAFTMPTQAAQLEQADVDKANDSFFGRMSPGDITVVQDPYTGEISRGRSGTAADIGMGVASSLLPTWLSAILGGKSLSTPAEKGEVTFGADLTPLAGGGVTYNDNFDMDNVSPPSLDEIQRLAEALNPSDPTDPATDPTPPAVKQYYKPPQWVLDRIAGNLNYGKGRLG